MFVCICHGYTDKQIQEAVAEGAKSVAEVYSCLGQRPRCGKCAMHIQSVIERKEDRPARPAR